MGDDHHVQDIRDNLTISIHVPRMGDDLRIREVTMQYTIFQSTSPVRGTTAGRIGTAQIQMVFQSTSPVRGTTQARRPGICGYMNFNPRPPHGGRHMLLLPRVRDRDFNPRPPHGGRPSFSCPSICSSVFQSTSPARGTTHIRCIRKR